MKIDVTQSNFNQEFSKKDKNGQYDIGINVHEERGDFEDSKYDNRQRIEVVTLQKRSKSITNIGSEN